MNPKVSDFGMVTVDGVTDASVGTHGFVDEAVNKKCKKEAQACTHS